MDPAKVQVVKDWERPKDVKKLRGFLGLTNYFRRFIRGYSKLVAPLTELTGHKAWDWTLACEEAFEGVKYALTHAPTLRLPDVTEPYEVWSDASVVGCGAVLMQQGQPVAYYSKKFSSAEFNYTTTDQECLGIYSALEEWRCYLEGCAGLTVITDHHPLIYLQNQRSENLLSRRQARWMEFFARFHFEIVHKPGTDNIADPISRVYESTGEVRLAAVTTRSTAGITWRDRIKAAYANDPDFQDQSKLAGWHLTKKDGMYLRPDGRVAVPNDAELRRALLAEYHDEVYSGHRGIKRTQEAISRTYWWHRLAADVTSYVATCPSCQRNKPLTQKPGGLLHPLQMAAAPWSSVSLDLIGPLPKSDTGNDAIVVFVDRLTKMTHFAATTTTCTGLHVADLFVEHVFKLHGVPTELVSDRDPRFTGNFWQEFMAALEVKLKMSSAYHAETDGQTERMNRLLEESLRHYVSPTQTDWDRHLPFVEFAINNSFNESIGTTPFRLNSVWEPRIPADGDFKHASMRSPSAAEYAAEMQQRLKRAKDCLRAAADRQKKYADVTRRPVEYKKGQEVMLNTRHINFKGPNCRKLLPKFIGPFTIDKMCGPVAAKLTLPENYKIHDVFHVSLLKPYKRRADGGNYQPPPAQIQDGNVYWAVNTILRHRERKVGRKTIREFLVSWEGYGPEHDTWEPESSLRESSAVEAEIEEYLRKAEARPDTRQAAAKRQRMR